MTVRVRFAASPTGLLHVGNARIALANHLFARRHGGQFVLRLNDAERERAPPEHVDAIAQDLRWLGIAWDECLRRSDRLDRYAEAAEALKRAGRLYPCFESEEELRAKRGARLRRGRPAVYDRAMLKLTPAQRAAAEAGGKRPYWRFLLSADTVRWQDLVLGQHEVKLASLSDPVAIRADGTPFPAFTSAVDDLDAGISHVIRGEQQATQTGVHIDLMTALGADPSRMQFAHLPSLTDADGKKPSKPFDGFSLRSLRHDGIEPSALAGYLARLGTSDDPELVPLDELAERFDLARVARSPPRFDMGALLRLNRRLLHTLPFAAVADRLPPAATEAFWHAVRGDLDLLGEARGWWDVVAGTIVPPVMEGENEFLQTALDLLPPEPWDKHVWRSWTGALKQATGRRGKALVDPLRLALTGEEQGPELALLLPLMGRSRAGHRLQIAAS